MARGIEKLHPDLQPICKEFVRQCTAVGLNVLVTETLRSEAEQTALYEQGRTKPGAIVTRCRYPYSPHCWGVAFDFCRNERGREYVDTDGFFAKCGAIGKSLGLTWGGDWKSFVDKPHLELTKFMPRASCKTLIANYGTPENFFKTWKEKEMTADEIQRMIDDGVQKGIAEYEETMAEAYAKPVSGWAAKSWDKAVAKGIFDNSRPTAPLTREQAAVVLDRLGLLEKGGI